MTGNEKEVLAQLVSSMTRGERAEAEQYVKFGDGHFAKDAALRYLRTGELPDVKFERVVALRLALAALEAAPADQRPPFKDAWWDRAMGVVGTAP